MPIVIAEKIAKKKRQPRPRVGMWLSCEIKWAWTHT